MRAQRSCIEQEDHCEEADRTSRYVRWFCHRRTQADHMSVKIRAHDHDFYLFSILKTSNKKHVLILLTCLCIKSLIQLIPLCPKQLKTHALAALGDTIFFSFFLSQSDQQSKTHGLFIYCLKWQKDNPWIAIIRKLEPETVRPNGLSK